MLTQEQLAMRRTGISGSEIAAIVGMSPWSKPIDIWRNKVEPEKQDDWASNPNLIRGTLFERPIIQWYSLLTDRTVTSQTTIRHPTAPYIMATPDGIATYADGSDPIVIEVKSPSFRNTAHWGEPGTDEIPDYYLPQVIFEMAVTGLTQADVVLFSGTKPDIYRVSYDDELFQELAHQGQMFMENYVLKGVPPPVDSSESYAEYLALKYPTKERVEPVDWGDKEDICTLVQAYVDADRALKAAKEKLELSKNTLKQQLIASNTQAAYVNEHIIKWSQNKASNKVDYKNLVKEAEINSDLLAKHTAEIPGAIRFTLTKRKYP